MLAKFEVENFKNFNTKTTFDFTKSSGYTFNEECIKKGLIHKAMIYGHNGSGKSNIGFAIFDIISHITDKNSSSRNYKNYLYAGSNCTMATFKYEFLLDGGTVTYEYGKEDLETLVFENIDINGKNFASIDRRKSNLAKISAKGAEKIKKDIGESQISIISYIKNNAALDKNKDNQCFSEFLNFVEGMLFFRSLNKNDYIGFEQGSTEIGRDIIEREKVKEFEKFLHEAGVELNIVEAKNDTQNYLAAEFNGKKIPFYDIASQGTISLALFYFWLLRISDKKSKVSFVFIDEFDAFYHHGLAAKIVDILKKSYPQVVITTHNTSVMTNELLRPDCYFFIRRDGIHSLASNTKKELREAHNIEKMYRAGAFNE